MSNGTDSSLPGKIGKYTVERIIGRGAMGVVYLARDPTIDRPVALKTIHFPEGLEEEKIKEYRIRFLREAQAAGKLSHPAIVTIYEADDGSVGGIPFIAMEYVEGLPWNYKVRQGTKQDPDAVIPLIREIASALDYAHNEGVVHRDIKPANIVQNPAGHVKLMDFGIAKVPTSELTQEGQFLGTPAYMSPEQIRGKQLDGRTDLFSLGTVLYELLTCKKPFPGDDVTIVGYRICQEDHKPLQEEIPDIPKEVGQIIDHLLAKDPDKRYRKARLLIEDIDAYLAGAALPHAGSEEETPEALPPPPPPPPPEPEDEPQSNSEESGGPEKSDNLQPGSGDAQTRFKVPAIFTPLNIVIGTAGLFVLIVILIGLINILRPKAPPKKDNISITEPDRKPASLSTMVEEQNKKLIDKGSAVDSSQSVTESVDGKKNNSGAHGWTPERKPANTKKEKESTEAKTASKTPVSTEVKRTTPATRAAPAQIVYYFETRILKGQYEILLDGRRVALKTIDRSFSLRSKKYTGSFKASPGTHTITFRVTTKIQDVNKEKSEKVKFKSGEKRTLNLEMSKLNKKISFVWGNH